jgi:hypothetical protein
MGCYWRFILKFGWNRPPFTTSTFSCNLFTLNTNTGYIHVPVELRALQALCWQRCTVNTPMPSIMQTHTGKDSNKTISHTEVFHFHTLSFTYTNHKTFSLFIFHLLVLSLARKMWLIKMISKGYGRKMFSPNFRPYHGIFRGTIRHSLLAHNAIKTYRWVEVVEV